MRWVDAGSGQRKRPLVIPAAPVRVLDVVVTYVSDSPSRWGERLVCAAAVAVPAATQAYETNIGVPEQAPIKEAAAFKAKLLMADERFITSQRKPSGRLEVNRISTLQYLWPVSPVQRANCHIGNGLVEQ